MHDTTTTLVAPAARQGGTAGRPSSEVRLARGLDAPSGEFHLAQGLNAPSSGVRLTRRLNPAPRVRSASLEGQTPPRAGSALLEDTCTHVARAPAPRVRAFNALTPQDARRDLGAPGNRVPALFHQLPGGGHPCRCVALCGKAGVSSVRCAAYPHMANTPNPRRGADSTLERLFCAYAGPRRDVRPAGSVILVAANPVRPSPPLLHHAGRCDDILTLLGRAGTRRLHDGHCATYGPPVNGTLESAHYGGRTTNCCATTLEAAPVRAQDAPRRLNRSRIRQDGRQLHGTARHAATRREIVRHTCKTTPSSAYKRRGNPPAAGGRDDRHRTPLRSPPSPRYWHLSQSIPLGLGGQASSPTSLVAPPLYEHHGAKQYSAPSTPLLDVRPRPEPG
jgi:hypothetical protein